MPTLRPILEKGHQREFETPPTFTYAQRRFFLQITDEIRPLLASLDTPANQTGFLVQLGYFRAASRFFAPTTFTRKDWEFAARRVSRKGMIPPHQSYADSTARRHRGLILTVLEVMPFAEAVRERCQQEANQLITQGIRPPQIFGSLCDFLRSQRMEIPAYSAFVDIINRAIQTFDAHLRQILDSQLDDAQRTALHSLLEQTADDKIPLYPTAPMQLTQLRHTQELMNLKAIRENVG